MTEIRRREGLIRMDPLVSICLRLNKIIMLVMIHAVLQRILWVVNLMKFGFEMKIMKSIYNENELAY